MALCTRAADRETSVAAASGAVALKFAIQADQAHLAQDLIDVVEQSILDLSLGSKQAPRANQRQLGN